MSVHKKILLIIIITQITLILVLYAIAKTIVLGSFEQIEEQHIRDHISSIQKAMFEQFRALDTFVFDWAAWDDTYNFIENANEKYITSNLVDETFSSAKLNVILFTTSSGQIVFGKAFDLQTEKVIPLSQSLQAHLDDSSPLVSHSDPASHLAGILLLPEGSLMVASRPILTSEEKGPIRGALIMGRYLDSEEIERLTPGNSQALTFYRLDDLQLPPAVRQARSSLSQGTPIFIQLSTAQSIAGYTLLEDIYGNPGLILRIDMPREIYEQGQISLLYFISAFLMVSAVFGVVILFLLEETVLSRLARLSENVTKISLSGDLSGRLLVKGRDEISRLAHSINSLLIALQQSQVELRENEERYRTLVETSPDAITVTDLDNRLIMANQRAVELYGCSSVDELLHLDAFTLIAPEDRERAMENSRKTFEGGNIRNIEYTLLRKDNSRFLAELSASLISDADGHPKAFIDIVRDITERKYAIKALLESEKRYRNLIENAPLGIISIDAEGHIMDVNPMLVAMLGAPSAKVIQRFKLFTSPSLIEAGIAGDFHQCLESGEPGLSERSYTTKWGRHVYLRYHLTPIRDVEGGITGVLAIAEDITEQKLVEEALLESEAEYRSLFKNMPSGFAYHKIVVDADNSPVDYIFLEVNEAYERLMGLGKEVVGKRITDIIPQVRELEPDLITVYGQIALNGKEKTFDLYFEPFGVWYSITAYSPERGYFVTILDDISERKWAEEALHRLNEQLEQRVEARTIELQEANEALQESLATLRRTQDQLIQSEKMAALGGLVAGVAHEINTPVGVGVTAASFLQQRTLDIQQLYRQEALKRSELEDYLKTAREASEMILGNLHRAANQIQGFKQVAVDQMSDEMRKFNVKTSIESVLFSLHPKLRKTRHTITVTCPENFELSSFPGAFSQIITNLVINSLIHGFEDNDQGEIVLEINPEEHRFWMRYSDNGKGMIEEERSRIFEPFYTTKRAQGGTGLGLYIVYNLVTQRLNGSIKCESAPHKGTSFLIEIPLEKINRSETAADD